MLTENQKTFFELVVEGVVVSRSEDKTVVELARSQLPTEKQIIAELKTVTSDGKQVLMG